MVSSANAGIRLLGAEDGDAAADVAGQRLHILERGHLRLAYPGRPRQLLEIQLRITGNNGKDVVAAADCAEQRLEDLLRQACRSLPLRVVARRSSGSTSYSCSRYAMPSPSRMRAALVFMRVSVFMLSQ